MNTDHFIALYDMENYIWTMTMASWTPLIIHDSYELQTSMISDHSKWGFIRFTRSMITHDCYEHWLWAITVHRNSYEFGFWTINDQTHHTWWGGINAMKCWCSYMINTDSVSYYDPYFGVNFLLSTNKRFCANTCRKSQRPHRAQALGHCSDHHCWNQACEMETLLIND